MSIDELRDKLQGIYDFSNIIDCHAVISMLLRDLNSRPKLNVMDFLCKMTENMIDAEKMTDNQLYDEVMQLWAEYNMDSKESSLLGELLKRFKEERKLA